MSRNITLGVVQCGLGGSREDNVETIVAHIEEAAKLDVQVLVLPELFEGPYFPREELDGFFAEARPLADNPTLERLRALAKAHQMVLPFSFFEKAGAVHYNSLAMIDADGEVLGLYRKSHIPDGPGYEEKFYFRPGDTGFKVWNTRYGPVGAGICWDQWFPECARAMALKGAEVLIYPTAIGSEPVSGEETWQPWQRAMIGHAVSNAMPVAAANRVGEEGGQVFYGCSFIADPRGDKVAEVGLGTSGVVAHTFDLDAVAARRAEWGFFRDRRPELYRPLLTADGELEV